MPSANTYENWQPSQLAPPWLQKPRGKELNGVLGLAKDQIVDAVKWAIKARFVLLCPPDALDHLGFERLIERYPVDTIDSYRARLAAAWETWTYAGTSRGMLAAFHAAGFDSVNLYDVHTGPGDFGTWPPDANPANWSRFWIELYPGANDFAFLHWRNTRWGEAGLKWGDGHAWGITATRAHVAWVRSIARKWKPAHTICAGIIVRLPLISGYDTIVWPGM